MAFWAWLFDIVVGALISWVLTPKPEDFQEVEGTLVNKSSNIADIPVIYGKRKVGGTRVFVESSGSDNEYLYIALVLAEGEVNSIGNVWINDVLSTDSRYSGLVTINKHVGTDSQTADSTLTNASSWTTDHKLSGVAYLGIRLKFDREVFSSIPTFHAEVEGTKCYDPRGNSGSGSTGYTTNPVICLLDYMTNSRYGKGLPTTSFETGVFAGNPNLSSSWHVAADLCDELVTPYTGSGTIEKFSCNTAINTGKKIIDNVKILLSGMRGIMPYTQGEYRILIEDELVGSPVFDFNEDHIIDGIAITSENNNERFNRAICTFANPDNNWESDQIEYPRAGSSTYTTYKTEDNGFELTREAHLNTVTSIYQAYNIAKTIVKKSRNGLRCSFLSTTEALQCAVGDIVTVSHSTPNWSSKQFRVMDMSLDSDATVTLSLIEHFDASYSWEDTDEITIVTDTDLPDPTTVTAPTGLTVASGETHQLTNSDGTISARMHVSWTDSVDAFVLKYIVQFSTTSTYDGEVETTGSPIYLAGVSSGATYNVRVKAVSVGGFSSDWVTTTHTVADLVGGVVTFASSIGVGTTTPQQEVDISSANPAVRLTDTTTSGLFHELVSYSNDLRFSADGDSVHGSTDIEFLIDGTERMKITNAGMVHINDGNLVISTSGHGIDFSATSDGTGSMTSELLDDYEEGTFTPVIADAYTGGNTGSAATIKGFYTKIGRLVNVSIYIINMDTTGLTSGNDLFFRGFPFTSNNASHHYADGISRVDNVNIANSRNSVSAVMTNNDSWCRINEYGDNVADDFLTVSDYTSGTSDVFINITYMV